MSSADAVVTLWVSKSKAGRDSRGDGGVAVAAVSWLDQALILATVLQGLKDVNSVQWRSYAYGLSSNRWTVSLGSSGEGVGDGLI